MTPNPHLERIIARENDAVILQERCPRELAVIALRLDDIPYDTAGEILGLKRSTVGERMRKARRRLRVLFPHIRRMVES